MTTRISPNLDDTKKMLEEILPLIMVDGERIAFLVPAGRSAHVLARIRVMISRKRKAMEARNRRPRKFTLASSVHPETHDGKRFDCIILWIEVTAIHLMSEKLEDLLANG